MSAISETYNRAHNLLELVRYLTKCFTKRNIVITNKNGKYELTDELLNNVRLKKTSKVCGIIV